MFQFIRHRDLEKFFIDSFIKYVYTEGISVSVLLGLQRFFASKATRSKGSSSLKLSSAVHSLELHCLFSTDLPDKISPLSERRKQKRDVSPFCRHRRGASRELPPSPPTCESPAFLSLCVASLCYASTQISGMSPPYPSPPIAPPPSHPFSWLRGDYPFVSSWGRLSFLSSRRNDTNLSLVSGRLQASLGSRKVRKTLGAPGPLSAFRI